MFEADYLFLVRSTALQVHLTGPRITQLPSVAFLARLDPQCDPVDSTLDGVNACECAGPLLVGWRPLLLGTRSY